MRNIWMRIGICLNATFQAFWDAPVFFGRVRPLPKEEVRMTRERVEEVWNEFGNDNDRYILTDDEALRQDWNKLGNDMRKAIHEYATQPR